MSEEQDRWTQTPEEDNTTLLIICGIVAVIFICVISTFAF